MIDDSNKSMENSKLKIIVVKHV